LLILLLEGGYVVLGGVGKQVSGLMQPRIGLPDGWPQRLRRLQSSLYKLLEAAEFVGKPLFSTTRLIESSMA
jgi:hypothetical protein